MEGPVSAGQPAEDATGGDEVRRHFSTGALVGIEFRTVNAWRVGLGRDGGWPTDDGRPPASSSDCIGAAVLSLLASDPAPLELAQAATRYRRRLATARDGRFPGAKPASFYLPAGVGRIVDELVANAMSAHRQLIDDASAQAYTLFPGPQSTGLRHDYVAGQLAGHGLPEKVYKVPAGTVARMAIRRWSRRTVPAVLRDAVDYASAVHTQPHRVRIDIGLDL